MQSDIYEKLMYDEWKNSKLEYFRELSKLPLFDKVWELRDEIYSIFYPLGINSNGIHDVCHLTSDLHHAFDDDGELTIVGAYLQEPPRTYDKEFENRCKELNLNLDKLKLKEQFVYFVCDGWCFDHQQNDQDIKKYATYHISNVIVNKLVIKNFNEDTFNFIYNMNSDFKLEKVAEDKKDAVKEYFRIKRSNDKKIEDMINNLK